MRNYIRTKGKLSQVNKATKDLDLFMRKDPPVLTMDEMRGSSTLIDK